MKNNLLCLVFLLLSCHCFAQFGVKAGLNFNSNGELKEILTTGENILEERGDAKIGYHVGVFYKIKFTKLYIRPELVYTQTKSAYDSSDYDMSKLDLPILVGLKVVGPLSVFAGPSFQYTIDNDFEDVIVSDVENEITAGFQFGLGLQFKKIGVDVRYERGFSENETTILSDSDIELGTLDARPQQLIFSLSYSFN